MEELREVEWFKVFDWSDNPFKIRAEHDNIVGFVDMRAKMLTYMKSEDPFIVTGPTGAGKTTLLKWLESHKKESLYFNFLGDIDEKKFKKSVEGNFLEKLVRRFSGSKKIVLIDEVQEMSPKLLKWIRGKFDENEINSLVLASIQDDLQNLEEPFVDRIGSRIVSVRNLTEDEALKMVKQRMFSRGKTNPFTEDGLRKVFEYSGFSPRKILENCETCCIKAARDGVKYLNHDFVEETLGHIEQKNIVKRVSDSRNESIETESDSNVSIEDLSPKQQEIIRLLEENNFTTAQIAGEIGGSRASIAKQLSRLSFKTDKELLEKKGFDFPLVEQKNKGRPVVYGLTKKAKGIL